MPNYIAPKISSDKFDWQKDNKCFCAEASDLPQNFNFLSQVYDDACDAGFTMVSARTGAEVAFVFSHDDRDSSGEDVYGWNFEPCPYAVRKNPALAGVTCLIIND
jgi:hypothetical protein